MSGGSRQYFGARPQKLKSLRAGELAARFAFGAGVSLVAGTVGLLAGARAGGRFLAFPAILPAALTIIEKKEGRRQAVEDERGAFFGAIGLVVFALVCELAILHVAAVYALLLALAAWAVTSVTSYLVTDAARVWASRAEEAARMKDVALWHVPKSGFRELIA